AQQAAPHRYRGSRKKLKARPERRTLFRLALALGMTVGEIESRMTSAEYAEGLAFMSLEPIGDARADLGAGIIASTIANVNRGKKQKPFTVSDFMPNFDGSRQDSKGLSARLRATLSKFKG